MAGMQTFIDETGAHRLRDVEYVLPVIVGTCAFPLGKKATEHQTHRWTVYLRGANNEDLSHIISRVQFDLHPSFNNAIRVVETQPYEVTEHGWGEFDMVVHVNFALDSGESEAVIYHRLRLYDIGEEVGSKQDPKKAVVAETYEELVFSEPRIEFYTRVKQHMPVPLHPPSQLLPYFKPPSQAQELEAIRAARARVAGLMQELRRELGATAGVLAPGAAGGQGGLAGIPGPGQLQAGGPMQGGMHMQGGGMMLGGMPGMQAQAGYMTH